MRRHVCLSGVAVAWLVAAAGASAQQPQAAPAAAEQVEYAHDKIEQPEVLDRLARKDPMLVVLDVRAPAEYAAGHVPSARNIAHDLIRERVGELADARDKEIVVYCRTGRRSQMALDALRELGFTRLRHLSGDYTAWDAAGQPVEGRPVVDPPAAAEPATPSESADGRAEPARQL